MDDKIAKMNSSGHEDLYTVRCARIHAVACIPCDLEEQNLTPGNFAHQFIEKKHLTVKLINTWGIHYQGKTRCNTDHFCQFYRRSVSCSRSPSLSLAPCLIVFFLKLCPQLAEYLDSNINEIC